MYTRRLGRQLWWPSALGLCETGCVRRAAASDSDGGDREHDNNRGGQLAQQLDTGDHLPPALVENYTGRKTTTTMTVIRRHRNIECDAVFTCTSLAGPRRRSPLSSERPQMTTRSIGPDKIYYVL